MSPPADSNRRARRVSFADVPNSTTTSTTTSATAKPQTGAPRGVPPNPSPKQTHKNSTTPTTSTSTPLHTPTSQAPQTPPAPHNTSPDLLSQVPVHFVTNTPHGLVLDGVLHPHPRGPNSQHPQPQPLPSGTQNSAFPSLISNTAHPTQVNMSTVGAGLMPDPNAVHYQPPVPDTTYGPMVFTYVPRYDPPEPQHMMPNGVAGGPPFYGPAAYQQVQPGMTTAPIPVMGHPVPAPAVNCQPGFVPPMAYGPAPGGPVHVVPAVGHPTPITPSGGYFVNGGIGNVDFGKTRNEVDAENQYQALHNQMNEPQDMKPADDDVSRMYWSRELDGRWISRSRFTLDNMGNFRWYVTENGVFYAKMLPE
ncbi:hypothetical protein F4777DRAFT_595691 [Nemania sp. FL0916]|nr:hypothetical protein F4777DRAFT_595691 [Nemania sp. FL0916]